MKNRKQILATINFRILTEHRLQKFYRRCLKQIMKKGELSKSLLQKYYEIQNYEQKVIELEKKSNFIGEIGKKLTIRVKCFRLTTSFQNRKSGLSIHGYLCHDEYGNTIKFWKSDYKFPRTNYKDTFKTKGEPFMKKGETLTLRGHVTKHFDFFGINMTFLSKVEPVINGKVCRIYKNQNKKIKVVAGNIGIV